MSVKGYSDYEQLAGGVETLFKKSSQSVINNASKAYQTAGMSANEYMETVTGFSASLLQSLGGDTKKAADKADMAIRDMSDNANKMGTDIESIQNAYQGFAKLNYTMLDNLKLGYGGTKEEMERLLADAEKISGIKYDVSSYSDIVDAIHVVQNEMEITGTTAKEASTTIQGSLSSAKAAWENLLTGLSDDKADIDKLINNFFDSVVTVGENIIPRIGVVLNGITNMIEKLAPKITAKLPSIFKRILPSIVKGATSLLSALTGILPELSKTIIKSLPDFIASFKTVFKGIVDSLPSLMKTICDALPTLIPQVITAITDMIVYLMKNIDKIIQPIIDNLPKIIISVVDALVENVPKLIEGAIQMVLGIVKNIPKIIKGIIEALPEIIEKVITGLIECIPQLIEGIIELVLELTIALPDIIVGILEAIPDIMGAIGEAFVKAGPKMIAAFERIFNKLMAKLEEKFPGIGEWFAGIWENITGFFSGIGEWFAGIWNTITESWHMVFDPWVEIFKRAADWVNTNVIEPVTGFFQGLWEKVSDGASQAWEGVKNAFSPVIDWFKNTFHEAWTKVKDVFSQGGEIFTGIKEGLFNGFKVVVNGLIDGINYIIGETFWGLNNALQNIHNVEILGVKPFEWINTIDVPEIPKLAKGGVVEGGTPFIAGEAGAEAVIPLENNIQWVYKFAHAFADGLNSFYDGDNFTQTPNKGAGGKVVNINLYLDNVNVKNDDDIEDVANKVSERIAEKLVMEGMAVG